MIKKINFKIIKYTTPRGRISKSQNTIPQNEKRGVSEHPQNVKDGGLTTPTK
jgi:hypothetical protein